MSKPSAKIQTNIKQTLHKKLFPKITELELFIIIIAPVILLIVQPELLKKFVLIADLNDVRAYVGVFVWVLFLVLLFGLSISSILRRKKLRPGSKVALLAIYYYILFGLGMAAVGQSWDGFTINFTDGFVDTVNKLVVAWFFFMSCIQNVVFLTQDRSPKSDAQWGKIIEDRQYHPLVIASIIPVQVLLFIFLSTYHTGFTLLYLTLLYTRIVFKVFEKLYSFSQQS